MTLTRLAAYVVLGVLGIIILRLAKSAAKPTAEAYLWLIGCGWLIGAALALYAWKGAR